PYIIRIWVNTGSSISLLQSKSKFVRGERDADRSKASEGNPQRMFISNEVQLLHHPPHIITKEIIWNYLE
ncbi:MAG TPA: hypothetical protein VM682_07345, partial [Bacillus sp. (in: firmicutes)]|nr:hypothetical protein [Bacillus sp. (in: firmicutes)]